MCGATRDEETLDVAHIIPPSRGGKTVYENLQLFLDLADRIDEQLSLDAAHVG
ncbi:MAG: HNH endonuclease [Bacillota bacterium]